MGLRTYILFRVVEIYISKIFHFVFKTYIISPYLQVEFETDSNVYSDLFVQRVFFQ